MLCFFFLKVKSLFQKAHFHLYLFADKHPKSFFSRSQQRHHNATHFFYKEHLTTERFATVDRTDIEIHDFHCESGRTWQLLTCCDALVRSLADNPSVLHGKHRLTAGYVHANFPLFSHMKHSQMWTCRAQHTCTCIDAHILIRDPISRLNILFVGYER